jgi:3-oxoacyl-[acyl-carrier-protein] synthase II
MGVVSSAGKGCEAFGRAVAAGKQSFSRINRDHLSHLRATHAGIINGFDEGETMLAKAASCPLDRFVYFAESAGREALLQAKIDPPDFGHRIGLVFATCSGPMQTIERHYGRIISGDESLTAGELFAKRYYSGAKALSHAFGIGGVATTVVTACSASCAAIGLGADLIRLGLADVVLAGGSDTFSETTLAGFDGLKATCSGLCAPFSKPSGLNLGEAAAFLVLESLDNAAGRGAPPCAEILGFGLSNDAYHCTAPEPSGAGQVLAMERALADAGVNPLTITYVNAHGTGTDANDKTETRAIKRVFGQRANRVPVSSTKSMVGHCLGAAGALETVASILCLSKGIYPPTANFSTPRDGCSLDYVPQIGRAISSQGPMIKNNFAFGGNNASLVLTHTVGPDHTPPQNTTDDNIVITGIGIVSAAGIGNQRFCAAMASDGSLIAETAVATGGPVCMAGMVPDFDMRAVDRRCDDRAMDRSSRFATAATRLALSHSEFPEKQSVHKDLGLFLHLSAGPSWAESEHINSLIREEFRISQVNAFPYIVPNSVAGIVCKSHLLSGHNSTLCFGPGASLMGLGFAVNALRNGHAKALISLSVDELSPRIMTDLCNAGLMADRRPFGEGACAVMLETESHARERDAKILGRISSCSYSIETSRCNGNDDNVQKLADTITRACAEAGIAPSDIGPVCCTAGNGRETKAVEAVLGRSNLSIIDCAPKIGFAEATQPVYNMSYAILHSSFENEFSKKYILVVFASEIGINCATIVRKE